MIRPLCWRLAIYLATLIVGIVADGKLSIKLVHFENRQSMLPNGECCDGYIAGSTSQCNLCEYSFAICASDGGLNSCSICSYRTGDFFSAEHIVFGNKIEILPDYREANNPLQCTIGRWNGTLSIGITAYDEDDSLGPDIVSNMAQNVTINATKYGATETKPVVLEGKRRSGVTPKLTMDISVECKQNYLIPTCEEYCIDTDDATGHYKCNYDTGMRECLPGWYGVKCTKKAILCVPRNDTHGHYSCEPMTGEKICLPGWINVTTNCTQAMTRKTPLLPSTTEITMQLSPTSIANLDESIYQFTSLPTPGTSTHISQSSRLHSNLSPKVTYLSTSTLRTKVIYLSSSTLPAKVIYLSSSTLPAKVIYLSSSALPTEVTCLSTSTLPPKVTYLSTFQQSPATAGITATSQHTFQGSSHLKSTVNPILHSSYMATPAVAKITTTHIQMEPHSSQLRQHSIPCSSVESKDSTSSAATIAFEVLPSVSTGSKAKRTTTVLSSEPMIRDGVKFSNETTLVQNTKTVSTEAISKSSAYTRSPPSSKKNVIPTKNPVKSSTQPTTEAAKPTEKRKRYFDLSKLMAIGLSALTLIILFATVVALNKRKNRVQRIEPISIAGRYKKSSAGFTASTSPSMSSASTSVPSIGSMLERRVGQGSYMMQEYPSKPPSAASGNTERSMNSPLYMNKLGADQWSTYSGKRTQSSSSRETSGQYSRGEYELLKTSFQVESAFVSNERCNDIISSHPLIIPPNTRKQNMSL